MKTAYYTLCLMLVATQAVAQQQALTPLQQFLYNESGYAPPLTAAPAPQPVPSPAPALAPVTPEPYLSAYAAPAAPIYPPPIQAAPQAVVAYEEPIEDTYEARDTSPDALRMMLTSSGL